MENSLIPLPDGPKELKPKGDAGYKRGEMKGDALQGRVTVGMLLSFTAQVTAGSDLTPLSAAERKALLNLITVHFHACHSLSDALQAYQGTTLQKLREDAAGIMELDATGVDAAGGLAHDWTEGSNTVSWSIIVPFSAAEMIDESRRFAGLSEVQMADSSFILKLPSDPFKAQKSDLTMTKLEAIFTPVTLDVERQRVGLPLMRREIVNAKSSTITSPDGLVLYMGDEGALGTSPLKSVRVSIEENAFAKKSTLVDEPYTPADIQSRYEDAPDTDALEASLKDVRTPLRLLADGPLRRVRVGAVTAHQVTKEKEWEGVAVYFPHLTVNQWYDLVALEAKNLPKGRQLLAVSTASVEGVEVNDSQRPFTGATIFTDEDPEFFDRCGLICEGAERPVVWIPPHKLRQGARRILDAQRPSEEYPSGDPGLVDKILQEYGREVPAACNHKDGFRTHVMDQVRRKFTAAVTALAQEMQQQQALLGRR